MTIQNDLHECQYSNTKWQMYPEFHIHDIISQELPRGNEGVHISTWKLEDGLREAGETKLRVEEVQQGSTAMGTGS